LSIFGQNKVTQGGKQMFMDFKEAFRSINERKEEKYAFWELNVRVLNQLLISQQKYKVWWF